VVSETAKRKASLLSKEEQHLHTSPLDPPPTPTAAASYRQCGLCSLAEPPQSQWAATTVTHLLCSLRLFKAYHQVPRTVDDMFVGCLNCATNVSAPPLLTQQPAHKLPALQYKHSTVAGFKKALKRAFLLAFIIPDPLPSAVLPALKLVSAANQSLLV